MIFTPAELAAALGVIAFLIGIAVGVQRLWIGARPRPTTGELQSEIYRGYATTEALREHEQDDGAQFKAISDRLNGLDRHVQDSLTAIRRELVEVERRVHEAGEHRASKLHERIDKVLEGITELAKKTSFSRRV